MFAFFHWIALLFWFQQFPVGRGCTEKRYCTYITSGSAACQREPIQRLCPCTCVPSAEERLRECCLAQGVSSKCKDLCTYDLQLTQLYRKGLQCFGELGKWQYCSSNGFQNSRGCCVAAGVAEQCLPFCSGQLPTKCRDIFGLVTCSSSHLSAILSCQKLTATSQKESKWTPSYSLTNCK